MDNNNAPWFFGLRGRKRTAEQMDFGNRTTHSPPVDDNPSEATIDTRQPIRNFLAPRFQLPTPRFPGDGLDMRRPARTSITPNIMDSPRSTTTAAGNASSAEVIDLTEDADNEAASVSENARPARTTTSPHPRRHSRFGLASRGPRFAANIIDLSEDTPPPSSPLQEDQNGQNDGGEGWRNRGPESPEIEIVSARQLRLPTPRPSRFGQERHSHAVIFPPHPVAHSNDDDIEIVGERVIQPPRRPNNFTLNAQHFERQRAELELRVQHRFEAILRGQSSQGRRRHHPSRSNERSRAGLTMQFVAPIMNFGMPAFDMGMNDEMEPEPDRSLSPPLAPLPPAPEGYTRNPVKGEIYVCENCDRELGEGDTTEQREIWFGRCGHCYCGECTHNRALSKARIKERKGEPQRTKPFKACVALGCGLKLYGGKTMMQLFL